MEFSRQEYWCGLPFSSLRDLPNPGIEPESLAAPALAGEFFTTVSPGKPRWNVGGKTKQNGKKKKKQKPTTTSSNPKNGPWSNSSQLLFSCSDPLRISECHLPPLPASDLFIQLSCNSLTSPLDTALLLALLVPSDLAEQLGLQLAVAKKVNLWNRREREGWSWPSRLMEQRTWILPSVSFSNSLSDPLWCPAHFLRSASFTWLKIGHQPLP